jgi:hypothetical protein
MKLYLWGGIILVFTSLFFSVINYREYVVERDGVVVDMQIAKMPEKCKGIRLSRYAQFYFEGKTYTKQVKSTFCEHHRLGETVALKYLPEVDFVMFPSETVVPAFYLLALSLAAGIYGVVVYFRRR